MADVSAHDVFQPRHLVFAGVCVGDFASFGDVADRHGKLVYTRQLADMFFSGCGRRDFCGRSDGLAGQVVRTVTGRRIFSVFLLRLVCTVQAGRNGIRRREADGICGVASGLESDDRVHCFAIVVALADIVLRKIFIRSGREGLGDVSEEFAFAPYLALGVFTAMLFGNALVDGYMALFV